MHGRHNLLFYQIMFKFVMNVVLFIAVFPLLRKLIIVCFELMGQLVRSDLGLSIFLVFLLLAGLLALLAFFLILLFFLAGGLPLR